MCREGAAKAKGKLQEAKGKKSRKTACIQILPGCLNGRLAEEVNRRPLFRRAGHRPGQPSGSRQPPGIMIPMRSGALVCLFALAGQSYAQQQPNITGQREAMKKLAFLVGTWSGEAMVIRGPGETIKVRQTEDVKFKLNG